METTLRKDRIVLDRLSTGTHYRLQRHLLTGVFLFSAFAKAAAAFAGRSQPTWTLLIGAFEVVAALLLCSSSTYRWGAALASILGAGFVAFQMGVAGVGSPSCNCFGIFQLGSTMFGPLLAAAVFVCGISTWRGAGRRSVAEPGEAAWRRKLVGALILTAILVLAWQRGDSLAASKRVSSRGSRINLHLNQAPPILEIQQPDGKRVSLGGPDPSWRIYAFQLLHCEPCNKLEEQLVSFCSTRPNIHLVRIVPGQPLFPSFLSEATDSRTTQTLYDRAGEAARTYCDTPARFPFAVVLSPDGRVRTVIDGFSADSRRLASSLERVIKDDPSPSHLTTKEHREDLYSFENRFTLDSIGNGLLARSQSLLLTFVQPGCDACEDFQRTLQRALPEDSMSIAGSQLMRREVQITGWTSRPDTVIGERAQRLARQYQVTSTPTSVLLGWNGKVLWRQVGAMDFNSFQDLLESSLQIQSRTETKNVSERNPQ
jgi:hypothetical protein